MADKIDEILNKWERESGTGSGNSEDILNKWEKRYGINKSRNKSIEDKSKFIEDKLATWEKYQRMRNETPEAMIAKIRQELPANYKSNFDKLLRHLFHSTPETEVEILKKILELPTSQWPRAIEYVCHKFDELKGR